VLVKGNNIFPIELVLIALKKEMSTLAHSALDSPAQRDAYEYGRMVGNYAGLKRAIETIEMALTEESEDNDHGSIRRGDSRFISN
jgi:hypothetical protein